MENVIGVPVDVFGLDIDIRARFSLDGDKNRCVRVPRKVFEALKEVATENGYNVFEIEIEDGEVDEENAIISIHLGQHKNDQHLWIAASAIMTDA